MLERIFEPENVDVALKHLADKHDAFSLDGIQLSDLPNYLDINGKRLKNQVLNGTYTPYDVVGFYQLNRNGKHRFITTFATTDRYLLRLLYQVLNPLLDTMFKPFVYGYRPNRGVTDAISKALDYINNGYIYVFKIDIKDFFGEVSHALLTEQINMVIKDKPTANLIIKYLPLKVRIVEENRFFTIEKGITQGSSLSPLLSNIYLSIFDDFCFDSKYNVIRYADDISIFLYSCDEFNAVFNKVESCLHDRLKLQINAKKTNLTHAKDVKILGYTFDKQQGTYRAVKKSRKKHTIYYDWHRVEYQKLYGDYHIVSDGILRKKDFTLFFENDDLYQHMPLSSVNAINVYSNVYFTNEFLRATSEYNIPLNIYDKYRKYLGTFSHPDEKRGGDLVLAQCALYLDESARLSMAKSIVKATMKNLKVNIIYYRKSLEHRSYHQMLNRINQMIDYVDSVNSVEILMLK